MPERTFVDAVGRHWEVWEVCPDVVERRMSGEHAQIPEGPKGPGGTERRHGERRAHIRVPEPLRDGWLAFETEGQRRRLAPVPARWRTMTDGELEALLRDARQVPIRP